MKLLVFQTNAEYTFIKSASARNYGRNAMEDFLLELTLALRDYFCGEIEEEEGAVVVALEGGSVFRLNVEEVH